MIGSPIVDRLDHVRHHGGEMRRGAEHYALAHRARDSRFLWCQRTSTPPNTRSNGGILAAWPD